MKNILCCVLLAVVGVAAQAGGSATVTCGNAAPGVYNNGQAPVLNISYSTGADAGTPGLFWLGVLTPDKTNGAVMTSDQGWIAYQGGLYPFQSRYDGGLPGMISKTFPFPGNSLLTTDYVGYIVYTGHGAYGGEAKKKVADRRAALNSVKAKLVEKGVWNSEYEGDDRFIWSLIQKDMVDNQKYGSYITVPLIDCTIPVYDR